MYRAIQKSTGPTIAYRLEQLASPGKVLVSEATRQLLEPYIEFEAVTAPSDGNADVSIPVFSLIGEKRTEAMTFLS